MKQRLLFGLLRHALLFVLPVSISTAVGAPDSNTVGLWLFDESDYPHTTLTDASEYEKADLCLMDGGSMVAGKYGRALQVGSGYAVCYAGFAGKVPEEELREPDGTPSGLWGPTEGSGPLLNGLAGDTWTIELWLNLSSGGSGISIIDLGWAYEPGLSLTLNGSTFELVNYYAGVQAMCPTSLSTGAWHHVVFTRDGSTVRHFYDGVEQTAPAVSSVTVQPVPDLQIPMDREHESRGFENMSYEQRRQNRFNFAVGTDRYGSGSVDGMVDEMRISDVVRYTGNFTPDSFSRNYGGGALPPSVANGLPLLFDPGPVSIPLEIGGRKHVFIDDAIIDSMSGLQITMNQPYDKQAISKDFSIAKPAWRPSVFDVDGVVYMAIPEGYSSNTGTTYLATSPDGLDFTMQGEIITETPMYGSFFKDLNPNVHPEEQYKVNAFVGNRGMYFYASPDGVNWRRNETCQLALRSGGEGECFWDDQRGRYASYLKRDSSFDDPECTDASGRVAVGFWTDEILKAWPFYHMVTPYFEGYPFPSVTCEGPVEFYATGAGQVYRTRAIKYPWAPDVYLSFLWRYPGDDGPRHVDLGVGRDGENWSFFGTNWYIPLGSEEEELSMYGLIRRGDEIWQYVDEGGAHGGSDPRYYYRYRQRLDGFVSLDAGGSTGTATTLPMVFEGGKLALNISAADSAKVAITNQAGQEISGFGLSDCDPIQGDFIEHVVTWNGSSGVSTLAGSAVRLQFEMQNTKLYAFQFAPAAQPGSAGSPRPPEGAENVDPNVVLSWSPGENAVFHDVYFGTDSDAVEVADTCSTEYKGRQNLDANSYDPCGLLELGATYYWRIDELNGPMSKGQVWHFTVSDGKARDPSPRDGIWTTSRDTTLSWTPGVFANSHDVYFGTNFDNVNDANSTVTLDVYKGRQSLDEHTYSPIGLEFTQTYYWRIDEVNNGNLRKGDIWSFAVVEYIVIDDMEAYTGTWQGQGDNPLDEGWTDYFANDTGSMLYLRTGSPVRDEQSMEYWYDNAWDGSLRYCSESKSLDLNPTDWAELGTKILSLWFYGEPDNDANDTEQMYVGVEDDAGLYAELRYGDNEGEDINDIKIADWQQWNTPLPYFSDSNFAAVANDVDLADVNALFIGFGVRGGLVAGGDGTVFFDDIRLYPPRCVPELGPYADLSGDCIVDFADIEAMAEDWLYIGLSAADLYEDNTVNLKDFAVLADMWLKEQFWPPGE
jgi:hypothetical protein